jgi:hypothetical protein
MSRHPITRGPLLIPERGFAIFVDVVDVHDKSSSQRMDWLVWVNEQGLTDKAPARTFDFQRDGEIADCVLTTDLSAQVVSAACLRCRDAGNACPLVYLVAENAKRFEEHGGLRILSQIASSVHVNAAATGRGN